SKPLLLSERNLDRFLQNNRLAACVLNCLARSSALKMNLYYIFSSSGEKVRHCPPLLCEVGRLPLLWVLGWLRRLGALDCCDCPARLLADKVRCFLQLPWVCAAIVTEIPHTDEFLTGR